MARLSRQEVAWALYDWAASAYALCILAGFFPIFFESYWAADLTAPQETFWYGILVSVASLAGAILAPFIGTFADTGRSRKKWLVVFAVLGMCCTCGLILVGRNNWPLAGGIFILGTVGYYGAFIVYNSLLPIVSPPKNRHFVSGLGFAMGYLGGVILFAASIALVKNHAAFGLATETQAVHIAFLAAAIWWLLFTLPLLFLVHEPSKDQPPTAMRTSLVQLGKTIREMGRSSLAGFYHLPSSLDRQFISLRREPSAVEKSSKPVDRFHLLRVQSLRDRSCAFDSAQRLRHSDQPDRKISGFHRLFQKLQGGF